VPATSANSDVAGDIRRIGVSSVSVGSRRADAGLSLGADSGVATSVMTFTRYSGAFSGTREWLLSGGFRASGLPGGGTRGHSGRGSGRKSVARFALLLVVLDGALDGVFRQHRAMDLDRR
jgi:hypothetical protein